MGQAGKTSYLCSKLNMCSHKKKKKKQQHTYAAHSRGGDANGRLTQEKVLGS